MDNWHFSPHEPTIFEERLNIGLLMEVGILIAMGSHCYEFAGDFYLQTRGGPIGLAITAWIAPIIMQCFDNLWVELLIDNNVSLLSYMRYVDDSRNFIKGLRKGVRWINNKFFYHDSETLDIIENIPDDARNTGLLLQAMNSIMSFLNFTGESPSDYADGRLPTLDYAWIL